MPGISTPTQRTCERCGRSDVWDERRQEWTIAEADGERQVGNPYCIHEWDITGSFNPFEGTV
jgi:hypothetical protein